MQKLMQCFFVGEVNSGYMNQEYISSKKLIANMQPQLSGKQHLGGPVSYLSPYGQANPPLNDVERFSEYSQRTTRSTYKSSGAGSNHNSTSNQANGHQW